MCNVVHNGTDLGLWEPASLVEVTAIFSRMEAPWWIAGGHAIDLAVGSIVRDHDDIDVLILRKNQQRVQRVLTGWQCWVADPAGTLRLWTHGETLQVGVHDIWCRSAERDPWRIQVMLDESDGDDWVSRRCTQIRKSISSIGLMSAESIPYLAPEIQLFYKASEPRPKDEIDFVAALAVLGSEQAEWLNVAIGECYGLEHPWRERLRG